MELYQHTHNRMPACRKCPALSGLFSSFQVSVPQVDADVNREKAKAEGVNLGGVYQTMPAYMGSLYVNDFNRFGRTYQVNVSADPACRHTPPDILPLKTPNAQENVSESGRASGWQHEYIPVV